MNRSGYSDDYDDGCSLNLYRHAVDRAIKGKRGQKFLREMLGALDEMEDKRLIKGDLISREGVCAMGSVGLLRNVEDLIAIESTDPDAVGAFFGIARSLAAEIAFMNDEGECGPETPEQRWQRMRQWTANQIVGEP